MSYGKEYKINGKTHLIEISGDYICVSVKTGYDPVNKWNLYEKIGEREDYHDMYSSGEDLKMIKTAMSEDYYNGLYCLTLRAIESAGKIHIHQEYSKYIHSLVSDDYNEDEILKSSSDERYIYSLYYPTDIYFENFESITKDIIKYIQN